MDIIIRDGVIQEQESERIHDIMNEEGLLKKDFKNYIKGVPGPYYDLAHSHICIPRKFHMIPNFIGPQDKTKIKLVYSVTAGKDHIDENYLKSKDINWLHCPGSNAESVVNYVMSAIQFLHKKGIFQLNDRIGIIGYSEVWC